MEDGSYAYKRTDDLSKAFGVKDSQVKSQNFDLSVTLPNLSEINGQYSSNNNSSNSTVDKLFNNSLNNLNLSNLYYYQQVNDVSTTRGYALNGIKTDLATGFTNYNLRNDEVTYRYNPTHGIFGDLMESGIGKIADWFGAENVVEMNNIAAQDIQDRRNVLNAVNLYHSQGTIIGNSAMQIYAETFQQGIDLNGNLLKNADGSLAGAQTINNTQKFYAVGPAVLEVDWNISVTGLTGLTLEKNVKYDHDNLDSVRYLTAPSNLVKDIGYIVTLGKNINSPIYLPNPISTVAGVLALPLIEHHDVKNPLYSASLKNLNQIVKQDPLSRAALNNSNNIRLRVNK